MKRMLVLSVFVFAFFGVQAGAIPSRLTDPYGGTGGGPINGSLHVRVVYDGTTDPVEGAFVMAGISKDCPFPENWGFTSETGEIFFNHPNLKGPIMVTAGASGYQYFTLVSVDANDLVLPLKPITSSTQTYEVGDFVSGIDVDNGLFHSGDGNVDMAFVLPAMTLEELMSFDLEGLLGPMELIEIVGQPFEVPSNLFIPQQWEIFIEIIKDHYYLYLPTGDFTITALSGRIELSELLSGGDIVDLIPHLDWRETDIIDVSVTGNMYTADLYVDPDLSETVTLNLSNLPEDSTTWCISAGDLDALHGLGRLVPLGLNALDTPAGGGPGGGTVHMTTTAAVGKFAGMDYFPVAAVQMNQSEDLVVIVDRESHSQTYTENLSNFFDLLELKFYLGILSWNDVENPGTGSPDVHVQLARLVEAQSGDAYWEFMVHGDVLKITVPFLPPQAPECLIEGTEYSWNQLALGLDFDLPSFDFNNFAFSDIPAHGSHLAIDSMVITWPQLRYAPRCPAFAK